MLCVRIAALLRGFVPQVEMALAPGKALEILAEVSDKAIDILKDLISNEMRICEHMIRRGDPGQVGPAARGFAWQAFS
jgi:hypothetical protein